MAASHFSLPAATRWLLVSVLCGVLPATGADALPEAWPDIAVVQPGILAIQDPAPQSVVQQPAGQTPATAAPAKHHLSKWIWLAVIAGVAVGAGTAIVVTNRQPGRTSTPTTGVTVNVGSPTPGAP
jgi:hypothetical protein